MDSVKKEPGSVVNDSKMGSFFFSMHEADGESVHPWKLPWTPKERMISKSSISSSKAPFSGSWGLFIWENHDSLVNCWGQLSVELTPYTPYVDP